MSKQPNDRLTTLGVAGYYFFGLAGLAVITPYLPLYWKRLGFSPAEIGIFLTATGMGGLLALGPMGYLSDRLGNRKLPASVMTLAVAGVLLFYPLYRSPWAIVAASLAWNAAFRCADALIQAMAADTAMHAGVATWFARVRLAGSVGWLLSLAVSSQVALMTDAQVLPGSGWAAPMFLITAACYTVAGLCVAMTRPQPPEKKLRLGPWAALAAVARTPSMTRFLVAFGFFWGGLQLISSYLSLYLKTLGAGRMEISVAFSLSAIVETPFIFLAGRMTDRWGERRILLLSSIALPLRLLAYAAAPTPAWALVGQMLHGLTYGVMLIASLAYMSHRLPPSLRASGQSALGVVMSAAATASPFLGAAVAEALGYRGMFAVMAAVTLSCWWIMKGLPDDAVSDTGLLEEAPTVGG